DVSMLESLAEWMGYPLYYAYGGADPPPRLGAAHATIYPYGPFVAGDGRTVMLGLQNEREWQKFCEVVLEDRALASDPRFESNAQRNAHREALHALILERFGRLTSAQVRERLDRAQIANADMNTMHDVWRHPQLAARGRWSEVASPAGPLPALRPPGANDRFDSRMDPIPRVGEHNEPILHELGFDDAFIERIGNPPARFAKAAASGADAVIVDLEDAVAPAEKPRAREFVRAAWPSLAAHGIPVVVRVNAAASGFLAEDLAALQGLSPRPVVMLPKAESAARVARVRESLPDAAVMPLVETAAGLRAIDEVARAPGVARLAIGHLDFMADTGMSWSEGEPELAPLRFAVSIATRLAGLAPAVDGVTVQTDDEPRLREDTLRAKRFGFGGKLCIHPKQVRVVKEAFAPAPEELAWARRVVEADAASGGSAVKVDGRM